MAVARHLRYSPVNSLIVDWSANGRAFPNCGLPKPRPCLTGGVACEDACEHTLPIAEAIDTYDWARWLPEVIVGIDDPDEEIAANYVRQAAIDFCQRGRVLLREVVIELQDGVNTYPVFPYDGEQIVGVIQIDAPLSRYLNQPCGLGSCTGGTWRGATWQLDVARNEFTIGGSVNCGLLRLLVWAAPTEDSCAQDRFLYDRFRADITLGARRAYAMAVHFRDRALMATLPSQDAVDTVILKAKRKAAVLPSSWQSQPGTTFAGAGGCSREDYYFHRS